jgi:hypothetical protein
MSVWRLPLPNMSGSPKPSDALAARCIGTWHANFEPIPSLSFFRNGTWREWILRGDHKRFADNYQEAFPVSQAAYDATGLGIAKHHFFAKTRLSNLKRQIASSLQEAPAP